MSIKLEGVVSCKERRVLDNTLLVVGDYSCRKGLLGSRSTRGFKGVSFRRCAQAGCADKSE